MSHLVSPETFGMVAELLERIPRFDEQALEIEKLNSDVFPEDSPLVTPTVALLEMLQLWEPIDTFPGASGHGPKVRAKSLAATCFLRSLAAFLRQGVSIVSDWERKGVRRAASDIQALESGAQFLYALERKRIKEDPESPPIRHVIVAKAIIKARIRGRHESVYLVQYDPAAGQFQLIGGQRRATDKDVQTVMTREIREELPLNNLQHPDDYELNELRSDLKYESISTTYGPLSEYRMTFFQPMFSVQELTLGPNDRWVTLKELLAGETHDGHRIGEGCVGDLDNRIANGIDGLPQSLTKVQSRSWRAIARERRWEIISILLGIIAIILGVVFFALR
ncbi:MAG: hypothetical protein O7H41_21540 [Planctomycetota bacterium]|nr:hypothetical protein [Planctomycetota bacterium]